MSNTDSRVVHFHVFDPSGFTLFKSSKNDRAAAFTITCKRPDDCPLLPKGQCAARGYMSRCQYGYERKEEGFTRRARKFRSWIAERRAANEGVPALSQPPSRVVRIGDFVWLPYAQMNGKEPGEIKGFGSWQDAWLPAAEFTATRVVRLCEARPRALFGGEIKSYQAESVPKFVLHLSEDFPELLAEAAKSSARIREVLAGLTNVGRKALLKTLLPNVGEFIKPKGVGAGVWLWDGERLTAKESTASLFRFVPGVVSILPNDDATVTVSDDAQVGPDTVFGD